MDALEWLQGLSPFNLIAKRFQRLTLPRLQNRKRLDDSVAQRVEEFPPAFLDELENVARELPVVSALFDNEEIIDFAKPLPDFGELGGQQLPETPGDAHVRKIIACAANRAVARGVISMLRMIERLLHKPGE